MIETEIKEFKNPAEFYDWLIEQDAETTKIFTIKAEVHKINKEKVIDNDSGIKR